ncbi:B3 domain-containing transcription factor VRN1-like [Cucurbita moschata]|uniref:B3 domain-containing transcription factor VRN1-like n=1 Tax=Cucurbita moschata TaxID=3662 RepID=A0A6J1FWS9_CUCMO|nr:B3 domain-containing transcription factor VRN1-like [Cucurbita moschata]XP_022944493.1 B3 domain-containing transcription factor VRN1-like [Cucurbita moschata]XP_022944494.1 B3 domain-containing transcription factor VRN1-like [Cucurbita moschata]
MENSVTAIVESDEQEGAQSFNESSPVRRAGLFYKLVVPSILQDKKLKIPNKFAKKFADDLSDLVTLVVPNGHRWVLELKRHGRSMWFEDGWHDFVKHHCIQVGQLLVFRFEGNSVFNFYMFNLTAISNGPCNTSNASSEQNDGEQCPVTLGKEAEYKKLVEIFGTSSPDPSPRPSVKNTLCGFSDQQKFNGSCNGTSIKNFMHWFDTENMHPLKDLDKLQLLKSNQDIGIQFDGDELAKARENFDFEFSDETNERARKKKLKVEPIDYYNDNEPIVEKNSENIPHKISRMACGVEEFKPGNPFCWIVMRQSYVRRGFHLHIPSKFAEKYLKGVSGDITLQVSSGKQWRVRCIREGPGTKLTRGWADFVVENDLKEEDVCVFELIDIKATALKVTIFRVHDDPTKT